MTTRPDLLHPLGSPNQAGTAQCQTETALDQLLSIAKPPQPKALFDLLDQPTAGNPGLRDLFDHRAPWEEA